MRVRDNDSFLHLVLRILPQVLRVLPRLFVVEYAITLVDALTLVLTTVALQNFFDHVTRLTVGRASLASVMLSLALFALLKIINEATEGAANFCGELYHNKSRQKATWLFRSNRPPVPIQIDHLFRFKSSSHSGPIRPAIPVQFDHPFRLNSTGLSRQSERSDGGLDSYSAGTFGSSGFDTFRIDSPFRVSL